MKISRKILFLFAATVLFTVSCNKEDEDDTNTTSASVDGSGGITLKSSDITGGLPANITNSSSATGALVTSLTGFLDGQTTNFKASSSAVKTPYVASGRISSGTPVYSLQYLWSSESYSYVLLFGDDTDYYYWQSTFTAVFGQTKTSESVSFRSTAMQSKTAFSGEIVYESEDDRLSNKVSESSYEELGVLSWYEENSAKVVEYDFSGYVIKLVINADGSGSIYEDSVLSYSWNASGTLTYPVQK